jgi:adenylate kinase
MHTCIFIGPAGSGKGTQVDLLCEKLAEADSQTPIFHLQTGQYFRSFIQGDTYAAHVARAANAAGERQPDFLAMWIWSDVFVKNLTGREHLIIDGSPRSLNEAQNLDIALKFFKREKPIVFYISLPPELSTERLLERAKKEGRADDTIEGIKKRAAWFEKDVLPAVNYYRRDRDYTFVEIDGTQDINKVHEDIMSHLAW